MTAPLLPIRAGYIALLDAAPLIIARDKRMAAEEGIALELSREISWANIRDRVAIGHFDVAQMLAPLPVAVSLGLAPLKAAMIAPMALGFGGNAISVSSELWSEMTEAGAPSNGDPLATGGALNTVIARRAKSGAPPLTFATVHSFSSQHYELRYWLSASSRHHDINLIVLPPPLMPDALAAGSIDGFCAGEPWSSVAAKTGAGRIVTTKSAIWTGPDKVLGMKREWADRNPDTLDRLLRALQRAAEWCDQPNHREELIALLAGSNALAQPPDVLRPGLAGHLALGDEPGVAVPDFLTFSRNRATVPSAHFALWFVTQMVRWKQVKRGPDIVEVARQSFRPDLLQRALGNPPHLDSSGMQTISFFDRRVFDPNDLDGYLASLALAD